MELVLRADIDDRYPMRKRKRNRDKRLGRVLGRLLVKGVVLGMALSVLLVLPWRWLAPPTTAFMELDRHRNDREVILYNWVGLQQVSPYLAIAVVAAEDQKFPEHYGFDFESIRKAIEERPYRVRGASTISQQVAKNLYLWPQQSLFRKALEAWFTICIETLWPKERILEVYLNIAEFAPGVYGAEAAARHHFRTSARALDLHQATLLAAVLPSPKRMSARYPSSYVHKRAMQIETAVGQLGGTAYLRGL